jgi:hypothetical protein
MAYLLRSFSFVQIIAENRNWLRLKLEPRTDAEVRWEGWVQLIEFSLFSACISFLLVLLPAPICSFAATIDSPCN